MLNAKKVKGFLELSEANQNIFTEFLEDFYNSWGLEARATLIPVKIKFVSDSEGKYLRFDYKINDREEWLHITNSHNWY